MVSKSSIKKLSQSSLNSAPLGKFIVTLDEKNEELLSGGGNRLFVGGLPIHDLAALKRLQEEFVAD